MPLALGSWGRSCANSRLCARGDAFRYYRDMSAKIQPMIFVTGASRSGTTLMSHVLGRHSEIAGLREMQYFGTSWSPHGYRRSMKMSEVKRAVRLLLEHQAKGAVPPRDLASDIDAVLSSLGQEPDNADVFAATADHLARRAGKSVPCEQTPRNIYYAEALLDCFPDARFVHVLRDPRAVMASQKYRWRKRELMSQPSRMSRLQQLRTWTNYHPYIVARLWNRATAEAVRLQSHARFCTVRFEDLISEPEQTVRDLCAFLQVEYEDAMLAVEHVNSSHEVSTGRQTGFSQTSIESWKSALTRDEIAVVANRCGPLMTQTDYPAGPAVLTRWASAAFTLSFWLHLAGAALLNPQRVLIQGRATPAHHNKPGPDGSQDAEVAPTSADRFLAASSQPISKRVFGLECMDTPLDSAADYLVTRAQARTSCHAAFINAHCLNESVNDRALQQALQSADVLFADGIGMQIASRLHGHNLNNNVNGTDLFPYLCERAVAADVPIGLLGGAPGVSDRCVEVLQQKYPKLRINYVRHGFIEPGDDAGVVTAINNSGVQLLLVAMGVPRQERWVQEHGERLQVPVVISVGGLFDFVSGRVPRAPLLVRKLRMEWLFRLCVEPRRLFHRYVVGNPLFLFHAIRFAITGRLWADDKTVVARGAL